MLKVHLCGEASAINIVRELLNPIGEHVEVHEYKRKTSLSLAPHALGTLDNVQVCAYVSISRFLRVRFVSKSVLLYERLLVCIMCLI